ncbi:HIT family protein [Camelimonas fluminis]|uniref:HIT domain-containing protein n=1 Tax=Camelimonas fluminis TaxID=1576911 RepID=A0ABV7UBA5_9HYPH|nr:HIT domain-containing protein [Camelimonas fluminis]GHE64472.1 HIT family protein [Camelimonas fluminis]
MHDDATGFTSALEAGFQLDSRLAADCGIVGDLPLSRVLLMDDSRYDWLILVPRRAGVSELVDLDPDAYAALAAEMRFVCEQVRRHATPFKLNVAALGNMVRQLHVHVIARQEGDAAWPGPVWGAGLIAPYGKEALAQACDRWRMALGLPD